MTQPQELAGADDFARLADDMRRSAEGLRAAVSSASVTSFETVSADGAVTVECEGRPRVLAVRIDPQANRLDTPALSQLLTDTLNAGLLAARTGAATAVLASLDPALRSGVEAALVDAERSAR